MHRVSFILLICLFSCFLRAEDNSTYSTQNRLFHIERSKNKNLVCYDINVNSSGIWDVSNPVIVYWINREERPGERNGLSAIQKKLAFGYKVTSHDKISATIVINACSNRPIRVVKQNNKYCCLVKINNQDAYLTKIFVKTKSPDSISVEYVELHGSNAKGGNVLERITN